jgi:hypothetical protein
MKNLERKTLGASSSSTHPFRNPVENNFQLKAILPQSWCNHVRFLEATILDFAEPLDVWF